MLQITILTFKLEMVKMNWSHFLYYFHVGLIDETKKKNALHVFSHDHV